MTKFDQTDIEPLDFIVTQSLSKHIVTVADLIKEGLVAKNNDKGFQLDLSYSPIKEFVRYLYILKEYEACECSFDEDVEFARANQKTLHFKRKGGFKKIFSDFANDSLDLEIKLLQKRKLEYEEKIREQNDRIRNLTEKLKFISLIQKYWWVIVTCIGIGWYLGEVLDKLGLS